MKLQIVFSQKNLSRDKSLTKLESYQQKGVMIPPTQMCIRNQLSYF